MQRSQIKKGEWYINKRISKILTVEDYFDGLVIYHYLETLYKTRQSTEQFFMKNMSIFELDFKLCRKCGWRGLAVETINGSIGIKNELGEMSHVAQDCCPKCRTPTSFDKKRALRQTTEGEKDKLQ